MLTWSFERTDARLTWLINNDPWTGDPWTIQFGWQGRRVAVQRLDRDEAEQDGMLKHDDWMMDGKWLAFHRESMTRPGYHPWWRWGVAVGRRVWTFTYDGVNRSYDSPEAVAIREAAAAERRAKSRATVASWGLDLDEDA